MNKFFYTASIVLSVVFIGVAGYYANEVSNARIDYHSYNPLLPRMGAYATFRESTAKTEEMGLISLFFFAFFIASMLLGLIKVRTKTNLVFSIIGLFFSLPMIAWNMVMMSNPGPISFDEVVPAWVLYAFIVLAFSIIGLVQAVKYSKIKSKSSARKSGSGTELIDSEI